MSLFAEDAFLNADFVEIPCEFCDELYPYQLLMEHQSSCRPDLLHFNFDDEVASIAPVATISPRASSLRKVPEAKQKSPDLPKASIPTSISKGTNITSAGKQNKEPTTSQKRDPFQDLLKDDDDEIPIIFEDKSQEGGVKLMSYGSTVVKRTEEEKPSFRPPPLPLFDDQNKTKDSSNIISDDDDDDGGECLEDFWRRADIKNTQRLRKLKT